MAGERVYVPAGANFNVEHERKGDEEEIESHSSGPSADPLTSFAAACLAKALKVNSHAVKGGNGVWTAGSSRASR